MTLIELLVVLLGCALLGALGRLLFGVRGWLIGGVPFGIVVLLQLFGAVRGMVVDLKAAAGARRNKSGGREL